ncbi:MAG: WecB/TagA/CpsF family glycosyltransferase [Muribaculaceae bacterium]|nr:WecB/TagA/CpsF family glycosyltransferase [Muribaculaceae bacterium]
MDSIKILDINIDCITFNQLLETLDRGVLFTPNVQTLLLAHDDHEFLDYYKEADYRVCDSRVVKLCSRLLPRPIPEAIPGSSFFHEYCTYHAGDRNCLIYFIGAAEGVGNLAANNINNRVRRRMVVGSYSPPFGRFLTDIEMANLADEVALSGATVAVVGLGSPKQEKWIIENRHRFPSIKLWMALGATIDFEAGTLKRAPAWIQKLCLEWLFRFFQEPRRLFSRYFIQGPRFFYYFFCQLLKQ